MRTVIGYRFLGQHTYVAKLVTIIVHNRDPCKVPILCLGWGPLQSFRNRSRSISLLWPRKRALHGSSGQVKSCPRKLRGQLWHLERVIRPPPLIIETKKRKAKAVESFSRPCWYFSCCNGLRCKLGALCGPSSHYGWCCCWSITWIVLRWGCIICRYVCCANFAAIIYSTLCMECESYILCTDRTLH